MTLHAVGVSAGFTVGVGWLTIRVCSGTMGGGVSRWWIPVVVWSAGTRVAFLKGRG